MEINKVIRRFSETDMSKPEQVRRLLDEILCWMFDVEKELKRLKSGDHSIDSWLTLRGL